MKAGWAAESDAVGLKARPPAREGAMSWMLGLWDLWNLVTRSSHVKLWWLGWQATLLRRQSGHAPSFLIKAALSLDCWERGPVRLLLVRRVLETSAPSLREKMDWCRLGEVSALYDVLLVSVEARVAVVAWVEMDEVVSLRGGGEDGWAREGEYIGARDGVSSCGRGMEPGDRAGEREEGRPDGA